MTRGYTLAHPFTRTMIKRRVSPILRGMRSVFDLAPRQRETKIGRRYRDISPEDALAQDWLRIGQDIRKAMDEIHEQEKP